MVPGVVSDFTCLNLYSTCAIAFVVVLIGVSAIIQNAIEIFYAVIHPIASGVIVIAFILLMAMVRAR